MKKFECKICNYSTNRKYNLNIHYKSKKHKNKNEKFIYKYGKSYKYKSGLCKHKKKCVISKQIKTIENQIFELKNENKFIKKKANILTNELIKSNKTNTDIINEVKKIKEKKSEKIINNTQNNIINNTQNISINVFLNEHCKNAMNLVDFVEKIQVTIEDLKYTGQTNYAEGISRILIKNLNKLSKIDRPIHCSDVKRNVLYIKNDEGWEKDKKHDKINKCIKDVEFKQIQKIPEWKKEENINIYKNNVDGMKYQKVVFNSMGGIDPEKREKNKNYIIKKISKKTDFKD